MRTHGSKALHFAVLADGLPAAIRHKDEKGRNDNPEGDISSGDITSPLFPNATFLPKSLCSPTDKLRSHFSLRVAEYLQ
jgi:hypothetical protein